MGIKDLGSNLDSLSSNITKLTGQVSILTSAYNNLEKAIDVGEIRKVERGYTDLTRTLQASSKEIELLKANVDKLSKATAYYSTQELAQMSVGLRQSTNALSLYRGEHEKLLATFSQFYKRDAGQFLSALDSVSSKMPAFGLRFQKAAQDTGTLMEVFKSGGPAALSAWLTATGGIEKATNKMTDNVDDMLTRISKKVKDFQTQVGSSIGSSFASNPILTGGALLGGGLVAQSSVSNLTKYFGGATDKNGNPLVTGKEALGSARMLGGVGLLAVGHGLASYAAQNDNEVSGASPLNTSNAARAGSAVANIVGGGAVGGPLGVVAGFAKTMYDAVEDVTSSYDKDRQILGARKFQGLQTQYADNPAGKIRGSFLGNVNSVEGQSVDAKAYLAQAQGYDNLLNSGRLDQEEAKVVTQKKLQALQQAGSSGQASASFGSGQLSLELAKQNSAMNFNPDQVSGSNLSELFKGARQGLNVQAEVAEKSGDRESLLKVMEIKKQLIELDKLEASSSILENQAQEKSIVLNTDILEAKKATANLDSASYKEIIKMNFELSKQYQERADLAKKNAETLAGKGDVVGAKEEEKRARDLANKAVSERLEAVGLGNTIQNYELGTRIQERGLTSKGKGVESNIADLKDEIQVLALQIQTATDPKEKEQRLNELMQKGNSLALAQESLKPIQAQKIQSEYESSMLGLGAGGKYAEEQNNRNRLLELEIELKQKLEPLQRKDLENQKEVIEMKNKMINSYGKEQQNLGFQTEMASKRVALFQALGQPIQAAKEMGKEIQLEAANMSAIQKELAFKQNSGKFSKDEIQPLQLRLADAQLKIANGLNFQRRTLGEQFAESAIGMSSGSYLNPTGVSGYGMMGSGYFTGKSMGGKSPGSYQNQLRGVFGEGIDERSPWEQAMAKVIGDLNQNIENGLKITGTVNIDSGKVDFLADTKGQ